MIIVDCLNLIFDELQANKNTLHSCLLVNREWCHLVVPILWRKYPSFLFQREAEKKLYNIILSCLPSSSRQLLFDNDIKLPSTIFSKPLLFDYISFCKYLESKFVNEIVDMVFKDKLLDPEKNNHEKSLLLEQEIYKLFISKCKNIKELVWRTKQPLLSFIGASTCFSQLYGLKIDVDYV